MCIILKFVNIFIQQTCPSGLRGSTQVRVYSYSWVQIPQNASYYFCAITSPAGLTQTQTRVAYSPRTDYSNTTYCPIRRYATSTYVQQSRHTFNIQQTNPTIDRQIRGSKLAIRIILYRTGIIPYRNVFFTCDFFDKLVPFQSVVDTSQASRVREVIRHHEF